MSKQNGSSPSAAPPALDQIREAERAVTRRLAAAREASEQKLAAARAEARLLLAGAEATGRSAGAQARATAEAETEALTSEIIWAAEAEAGALGAIPPALLAAAAANALLLLLGLAEQPESHEAAQVLS